LEAFTSFHVNLAFKKQWPETVAFTDIHAQLEKIDTAVTELQRVAWEQLAELEKPK
jgi:hypothetical protein